MAGRGSFQVRSLALSKMGLLNTQNIDVIQAITYECYDLDLVRPHAQTLTDCGSA